jgi:hypothetical protein
MWMMEVKEVPSGLWFVAQLTCTIGLTVSRSQVMRIGSMGGISINGVDRLATDQIVIANGELIVVRVADYVMLVRGVTSSSTKLGEDSNAPAASSATTPGKPRY